MIPILLRKWAVSCTSDTLPTHTKLTRVATAKEQGGQGTHSEQRLGNRVFRALMSVFFLCIYHAGRGRRASGFSLDLHEGYFDHVNSSLLWDFLNKQVVISYITSGSPAKCPETPTKPMSFSHTAGSSRESSAGEVRVAGRCEMWPSRATHAPGHGAM